MLNYGSPQPRSPHCWASCVGGGCCSEKEWQNDRKSMSSGCPTLDLLISATSGLCIFPWPHQSASQWFSSSICVLRLEGGGGNSKRTHLLCVNAHCCLESSHVFDNIHIMMFTDCVKVCETFRIYCYCIATYCNFNNNNYNMIDK